MLCVMLELTKFRELKHVNWNRESIDFGKRCKVLLKEVNLSLDKVSSGLLLKIKKI